MACVHINSQKLVAAQPHMHALNCCNLNPSQMGGAAAPGAPPWVQKQALDQGYPHLCFDFSSRGMDSSDGGEC